MKDTWIAKPPSGYTRRGGKSIWADRCELMTEGKVLVVEALDRAAAVHAYNAFYGYVARHAEIGIEWRARMSYRKGDSKCYLWLEKRVDGQEQ